MATTSSFRNIYISWEEIVKLIYKMAHDFFSSEKEEKYDTIIGMQRGGIILATVLHTTVSGFKNNPPKLSFLPPIFPDDEECSDLSYLKSCIENKNVLLFDDVVVTGKTMKRALDVLQKLNPKSITTVAALCLDRDSAIVPKEIIKYTPDRIIYKVQKETIVPWRPFQSTDLPFILDMPDDKINILIKLQKCAQCLTYDIFREDDKITLTKEIGENYSVIIIIMERTPNGTRCRVFNTISLGESFSELLTQEELKERHLAMAHKELNDLLDCLRKDC